MKILNVLEINQRPGHFFHRTQEQFEVSARPRSHAHAHRTPHTARAHAHRWHYVMHVLSRRG